MKTLSVKEFVFALGKVHLTPNQTRMLRAHYHAPGRCITATKLADAVGFKNYNAANLWYGKLGHSVAALVGYIPEVKCSAGTPSWTHTLATGGKQADAGEWEWTMKPNLTVALERLGWVRGEDRNDKNTEH